MKCKLLILTLVMMLFTQVGCCESEGSSSLLHDGATGYLSDFCFVGDTCIVVGANSIFSCDAQGNCLELMVSSSGFPVEVQTALLQQKVDVFSFDGEIYCLDTENRTVYLIGDESITAAFQMTDKEMYYTDRGETVRKTIERCAVANNKIYVLMSSFTFEKGTVKQLYTLGLDGTLTFVDEEISDMTCTNAGTLLLQKKAENGVLIEELDENGYCTRMQSDDKLIRGMAYDGKNDILYYTVRGGNVESLTNGKTSTCASVPFALLYDTSKAYASDNVYYYLQDGNLIIRNTSQNTEANKKVLRVLGMLDEDVILHYEAEHPEITIEVDERIETELGLQQALISEDASVDMFVVSSDDLFLPVAEKGYYVPLEQSEKLSEKGTMLYAWVKDVAYKDHHLVAWPISADVRTWTVNVTQWEALGLGDVPETWSELLDDLQRWRKNLQKSILTSAYLIRKMASMAL